ncbi:hypothetical protein OQA88_7984 [Cercophora sp. LCS_1]
MSTARMPDDNDSSTEEVPVPSANAIHPEEWVTFTEDAIATGTIPLVDIATHINLRVLLSNQHKILLVQKEIFTTVPEVGDALIEGPLADTACEMYCNWIATTNRVPYRTVAGKCKTDSQEFFEKIRNNTNPNNIDGLDSNLKELDAKQEQRLYVHYGEWMFSEKGGGQEEATGGPGEDGGGPDKRSRVVLDSSDIE